MLTVEFAGHFDGSVVWVVAILVAHGAGSIYQQLLLVNSALRAAQDDLAERAATGERQRIAREVHDVIAHTLAVTMLHLTGARMALKRGDAADAEAALVEAERLGRQSLADVRRTVGLLAQGPQDTTAPPEPSAADVGALVRGYADAGLDVEYQLTGELGGLSLATGLGLYRIVQESLANAARHAPESHVAVSLAVEGTQVVVHVTNTAPAVSVRASVDGRGVDGINERAALLGGQADVGPTADGGWRVRAAFPT
jgi:signal transduction histidine kinase